MNGQRALRQQTLLEIADVLGIEPDTVLRWIIEGDLLVAFQGYRTVLLLDANRTLKHPNSGRILILSKHPANQTWRTFSC